MPNLPDWLFQLQNDVTDCLNGDFQFPYVPFASFRKLVISKQIAKALPHLAGKGGKVGIGGIVNMPTILDEGSNVTTPQTEAIQTVDIIEEPELNFYASNGAQMECELVARQARAVIRPLAFIGQGGLVGCFYSNEDEPSIAPIVDIKDVYPGCAGYRLTMRIKFSEAPLAKTTLPVLSWAGDTFTLTNPGGTRYYTTDGSFPGPGNYGVKQDGTNGTAVQYAAPVAVASGTLVRYAAYAANSTGSDVGQAIAP